MTSFWTVDRSQHPAFGALAGAWVWMSPGVPDSLVAALVVRHSDLADDTPAELAATQHAAVLERLGAGLRRLPSALEAALVEGQDAAKASGVYFSALAARVQSGRTEVAGIGRVLAATADGAVFLEGPDDDDPLEAALGSGFDAARVRSGSRATAVAGVTLRCGLKAPAREDDQRPWIALRIRWGGGSP